MIAQQHTIPSLSGTFGIHTRLALNPKMPKEPSSPSRSNTRTERQCVKIEIYRLENNNGQRTTSCIVHLADSANIERITSNRPCSGLTGLCFESPNDTIHLTDGRWKMEVITVVR